MKFRDICQRSLLAAVLAVLWGPSCVFAQLSLPEVFSDHMVLQREKPIPIWGNGAEPGSTVSVGLEHESRQTTADSTGAWKIKLPARPAGGPAELKVTSGPDTVAFTDILIGEVWVASGQSNMAWPLNQSEHFDSVKPNLDHPNIRLFKMEQSVHHFAEPYTDEELQQVVQGAFYQPASWERSTLSTASDFSAVAYYFAQNIQDSLNVPVGIIQNAIGGSPTQAWLSRKALLNNHELKKYVPAGEDSWLSVEEVHPYISSRVKENLGEVLQNGNVDAYQHPFAPFYLYDHGIAPLIPYGIRGVLWYQGESNADYPQEHQRLFEALIRSWRQAWKQDDFPFLYVQLPSIEGRNRWPEFREGQRETLQLPNTGMAVTIDLGDQQNPENVHPPKKQPVGRRLGRIALGKVYDFGIEYKGPSVSSYLLEDQQVSITFDHTKELATSDGQALLGLTLQGYEQNGSREQIIEASNVKLKADSLIISIPEGFSVTKIKYAWAPYPDAHLINEAGLPASPFKIELPGNF